MKNLFRSIAIIALVFVTTTSMANEPEIILEPTKTVKGLVLKLDVPTKQFVLKLADENLNTIYSENILEGTYAKEFNMKELQSGTYYFSIESAIKSITYTLNVKVGEVKIVDRKEKTNKPVFKIDGDKVYVNVLNSNQQKVDIKILDNQDRTVFNENFNKDFKIGKILNFEKAVKGEYRVVVKEGTQIYSQNILVD